jgi:hypothetical protein
LASPESVVADLDSTRHAQVHHADVHAVGKYVREQPARASPARRSPLRWLFDALMNSHQRQA